MIYFLTLPEGAGHVGNFVRHFGRRAACNFAEVTYGDFLGREKAPHGVYVFTDRNRMSEAQRTIVGRLWNTMAEQTPAIRMLNNPHAQFGRYALLDELHRRGNNDFQVWRVDEIPNSIPFPVFVRKENDHYGPRSGLLNSPAQLWRALASLALEGIDRRDMLVCQFQETVDSDGIYRKYGAFRVGPAVFGQFVLLERRWEKSQGERIRTSEAREENERYFQTNPHANQLMPLFELAGVDYGRMDYSFSNGRIQVWEINDNPFLAMPVLSHYIAETGPSRYLAAFEDLIRGEPTSGSFSLNFDWTVRDGRTAA